MPELESTTPLVPREMIVAPVPSAKSRRKQIFTQNRNSILSQLNGAEVIDGILRAETRDGSDYKLIFWIEQGNPPPGPATPPKKSKLLEAWLKGGRSRNA